MTMFAMDEARRREPKASYNVSDHVFSLVRGFGKESWMTYQRKHKTGDSTVSPHPSDRNQSRNEGHTGGNCSHEIEDKHDIGSTLHSAYAVLDGSWPS